MCLDGAGVFTFANGNVYEGEWKDDKRNRQGAWGGESPVCTSDYPGAAARAGWVGRGGASRGRAATRVGQRRGESRRRSGGMGGEGGRGGGGGGGKSRLASATPPSTTRPFHPTRYRGRGDRAWLLLDVDKAEWAGFVWTG